MPRERSESGELVHVHTPRNVHLEMLYQVARDYSGIGDPMSMTMSEIRFWYAALRAELRAATKPK